MNSKIALVHRPQESQHRPVDFDTFGRTGCMQVLHIEIWYADGTRGEINVTSPHVVWGEDVETQWIHMRNYIKSQYVRLGIVKYHAHCYAILNGELKRSFSWFPFDLLTNTELRS